MIELLVTCILLAGSSWVPPIGWTIERVATQGPTTVVIRRAIAPDEAAAIPAGCLDPAVKANAHPTRVGR